MSIRTADQYKSFWYQRTAELERIGQMGIPIKKVYEKETKLVLKAAGLDLKEGDRILDLAAGEGHHADLMRDITHADIDAYDIAEIPLERAKSRELEKRALGIRGKINFALGSYENIVPVVPENSNYRLITIFGSSFGYLKNRTAHEAALRDFYSLLEDGGKLTIQFRDRDGRRRDNQKLQEAREKHNIKMKVKTADGPGGKFGIFAKQGEEVTCIKDLKEGDAMYWYEMEPQSLEGLQPSSDGFYKYKDADGVGYVTFGKAYVHPDGTEEDLGSAELLDYVSAKQFPILKQMLEKAGFKNVKIEQEPLSVDQSTYNYVVVAEK